MANIQQVACTLVEYQELSGCIARILLTSPREQPFIYQAGQYIEILLDGFDPAPFSIANAPSDNHLIELNIRHLPNGPYTGALIKHIREQKELTIVGPYGKMFFPKDTQPMLLLAGGTGFAPFKALLEYAKTHDPARTIFLYWGARTKAGLYWHDELLQFQKALPGLHYIPVLSQPLKEDHWQGEMGWVHEVLLKHHTDLSSFHVYASGPPEMVFGAQKTFLTHGMKEKFFYSDLI